MESWQAEDREAPFGGANKWGPRIMFAGFMFVSLGAVYFTGEWQYLLFLLFIGLAWGSFEIVMVVNKRRREWIWREGENISAVVVDKVEVRGMNRICAEYVCQGMVKRAWSSVGARTFFQLRKGEAFCIRVHTGNASWWVPAELRK